MSFPEFARAIDRDWPSRGAGLILLKQQASTHLLARRIVEEYSAEGAEAPPASLLAWQQTEGRGRLAGRQWVSPAGQGIYATLIRPVAPKSLQMLPLIVAVALTETVNSRLGGRGRIKWPNDLWVEGRKLGGILIDATSRGQDDSEGLVLISFGVNHGRGFDSKVATSMELEAPGAVVLSELAVELTRAVDRALTASLPAAEVITRYRELSLHKPGETLRCRVGEKEIAGIFEGFDARGFLRLRVGDEERLLTAGEVSIDG